MIKAVIFDADGPLYQRTRDNTAANVSLLKEYGFDGEYSKFVSAYNQEIRDVYDRSETVDTLFSHIFAQLNIKADTARRASFIKRFYIIRAQISPSPDAVGTLKWVHENGYKVCVLTDHYLSSEDLKDWFKNLDMSPYLDEVVSSFDTRHLKNTPEAYQACLSRLKLEADEAVFVGHQQYEMDGANKAGIVSICLSSIAIPPNTKGTHTIKSLIDLPDLLSKLG